MNEIGAIWVCVCRLPGGKVERTEWLSQDGADQMADETEQHWRRKRKRAVCTVEPAGDGKEKA